MNSFSARSVTYDWGLVWDNRDMFWWGLVTALQVSFVALFFSMVFGMVLALARMGKRPGSILAATYINIFRGIPALVSVIWVYFGWSLLVGFNFTVFQAGVIALTLLYSAFFAEIFRSALTALSPGQSEAGLALGMSRVRVFFSDQVTTGNQDRDSEYWQHVHRDGQGYFGFYGHRTCRDRASHPKPQRDVFSAVRTLHGRGDYLRAPGVCT